MPTIEVSYKDLCNLLGKKLSIDEMREALMLAKSELDDVQDKGNDKILKIDNKDTNRPDLWSAEGIAREIRRKNGLVKYKVAKSKIKIIVDEKVSKVRPLIACAAVRNIKIDENVLSQIIQLQEKVAETFGNKRKEVAIGVYDLDKVISPIKYTSVKGNEIEFVPLEFTEKMNPKQIIENHPKGKEYAHLVKDDYPLLIDSNNDVLSMPPIINSDYSGKITTNTKNLFVECTGYDFRFLLPAINVLVTALAERGGIIEGVEIIYPDKKMITPNLTEKTASMKIESLKKIIDLDNKEILSLLKKSGYEAKIKGNKINVKYPSYRQDIMHERDIIEDIIISYGYNKIEPIPPKIATIGRQNELEIFSQNISEILVGLGLQEIMSYILTNKKNVFNKMNIEETRIVEIENIVSANWSVFRNWLLPGMLDFLSCNKHIDYPQRIFEIGDCIEIDENLETKSNDIRKLAIAITDNIVNYEQMSSILDAFFRLLGITYKLKRTEHTSFIKGRCARIFVDDEDVGVIGEIHPAVLNNWELEKPVVALEINLNLIFNKL